MRLPERLRVILPGIAAPVVTGSAGALIGLHGFLADPRVDFALSVVIVASAVFAPLVLLWAGMLSILEGSASTHLLPLAAAIVAVAGLPFHPVLRSRRAAAVTVVGLVAWFICQVYFILAARAL